jgi:hypothetical protein
LFFCDDDDDKKEFFFLSVRSAPLVVALNLFSFFLSLSLWGFNWLFLSFSSPQSRVFVRLFLSSQEKIYRKRKETIRARTAVK